MTVTDLCTPEPSKSTPTCVTYESRCTARKGCTYNRPTPPPAHHRQNAPPRAPPPLQSDGWRRSRRGREPFSAQRRRVIAGYRDRRSAPAPAHRVEPPPPPPTASSRRRRHRRRRRHWCCVIREQYSRHFCVSRNGVGSDKGWMEGEEGGGGHEE